ncbi:glycoside hydrolase family 43 protein [Arachidicoccus ginsenosidimutans]|uniref:glycoside hydrolase family 43 protein n=1 Tax=Arachidicoccus sp. BS20 TaxID=1850526 RepID=UPI0009EF38F7|nr:glycoside hydrolase family 43 protein [Arachidicoccus sp. BS20]
MADPTIFYNNGKYYLYGTYDINNSQGIRAFVSDHLKIFKKSDSKLVLRKGEAYGTAGFWAPQIWRQGKIFYMAYVANEHIAIAKSSSLLGPFVSNKQPLIADKKTIDPFVFTDDNGKKYLFHVEFNNGNKIYVAQLKDDFSGIIQSTDSLCLEAELPWEKEMDNVVEGPTVIKHNGWYYLIYSANHFKSKHYAVGYAVSRSVYGPWQKSADNPILSINGTGKPGTGHGDIFFDGKGKMYYVFHTHNSDSTVGPRKTAIVSAHFEKDNSGADKLIMEQSNMYYLKLKP